MTCLPESGSSEPTTANQIQPGHAANKQRQRGWLRHGGGLSRKGIAGVRDQRRARVQRSIRDGRWKLIRYPQINKTQLFDLQTDPFELHDLAGKTESAAKVQELMSRLERALEQ